MPPTAPECEQPEGYPLATGIKPVRQLRQNAKRHPSTALHACEGLTPTPQFTRKRQNPNHNGGVSNVCAGEECRSRTSLGARFGGAAGETLLALRR